MYWHTLPGKSHFVPVSGGNSEQFADCPFVHHLSLEPAGEHSAWPSGYQQMTPFTVHPFG
jgi:hypothetical protein